MVVEVISPSTRRREFKQKREYYREAGVAEYWIVDPDASAFTVVRSGEPDLTERHVVRWHPAGATAALNVRLTEVFSTDTTGSD